MVCEKDLSVQDSVNVGFTAFYPVLFLLAEKTQLSVGQDKQASEREFLVCIAA